MLNSNSFRTVPQYFFKTKDEFDHLYHNFESCILYKSLDQSKLKGEYYISAHVFTIVLNGKKIIHTPDGEQIVIKEGEMVFIPKDLYLIQDIIKEKEAFESWLFFFSDELLNDFINSIHRSKTNGFQVLKEAKVNLPIYLITEAVQHFINGLIPIFSSINLKQQLVDVKLTELLHLICLGEDRKRFLEQIHTLRRSKRNVRKFMELNFNKPLKVEDYAYLTGRSLTTFLRDFKNNYDETPKQWLMHKRMEKAHGMLIDSGLSVTQVAYDVGYENVSHFIKAFKKNYQLSPKQLVMQHRKKTLE